MNIKKIIALVLSLMLAIGVCLAFASCGAPDEDDSGSDAGCTSHKDADGDGICDTEGCGATVTPGNSPSGDYFNENGELMLFKGGAPTFQVVLGADVGSAAGEVNAIVDTLNTLCTGTIKVVSTTEPAQDVEILIGTVSNRGAEYNIDKHSLGKQGYMVKQIGSKIVVLGGDASTFNNAISYLKSDVFGLKKLNNDFTDFAMASGANVEHIQSGYKVTDVKIAGTSIRDYVLVFNKKTADKTGYEIGTKFHDDLYTNMGVWLEKSTGTEPVAGQRSIVIRTIENDMVGNGYNVYVDDSGNLIMECAFEYLFVDEATSFFDSNIFSKKNVVTIKDDFSLTKDLLNITYEQFGAISGDGENDFEAIYAAHAKANLYGHIVNATPGAIYNILKTGGKSAIIMTPTNWYDAKFIIDDTCFEYNDGTERSTNIFSVKSGNQVVTITPNENGDAAAKALAAINAQGGIKKDEFTKLDLGLGRMVMVYLINAEHRNYVRYGINADNGYEQKELIIIDANGNITGNTGLLYDYAKVTSALVYYIDDAPITISGGKVETIANQFPRNYSWYTYRGIEITRSNVTVDGLDHVITGEGANGAPYAGFLSISCTNNVRVQNCKLSAHKAYKLETDANNTMGTYDIAPYASNNTYFYNVTMHNFFVTINGEQMISVDNGWWGIMGGNECKNLTYDTCELTRFDAHRGTYNATIKNSKVANITIIGGGKLTIENSEVYMSTKSKNYIVILRSDYGTTWNGEFEIVNTKAVLPNDSFVGGTFYIIEGTWNESGIAQSRHDFGYDCYMPKTVILDNFLVVDMSGNAYNKVNTIDLAIGGITDPNIGTTTINKYYVTEKWFIKNNNANYNIISSISKTQIVEEN